MAIDYFGHSAFSAEDTSRRLTYARHDHPEWFDHILLIHDPAGAGPFDAEISGELGIDARCKFLMSVNDKNELGAVEDALEFIYSLFGTDNLVITWGLDSIRPPLGEYPGMAV